MGKRINKQGFSLVELLVVIAIIGLLLGIVLPVLARTRAVGQQTKCQANLRQLGLALETYAGSRDDYYPSWSGWHAWGYYGTPRDGTGGDEEGPAWTEILRDNASLPSVAVYSCPSFPPGIEIAYFLSAYAAWDRHGERATQRGWIRYPSQFILSGDCTNPPHYRSPDGSSMLPFNDADIDNANVESPDWSRPLHLQKNLNILFGDGHAASHAAFRGDVMTLDTKLPAIAWGDLD